MSLNWLEEMKNSETFYLLQTNQSVTKIDGLLTLDVHSISVSIERCSSHTLRFKGEVFLGNSTTSKVNDEGTIQFRSHNGCITTFQGVRHIPESRYNLISLGALHREGFYFSSKGNLMEVWKKAHVMFQAERVSNIYVAEIRRLQLVDCSNYRLQKRWLWNNRRLQWIRVRMFNCTPKRNWD